MEIGRENFYVDIGVERFNIFNHVFSVDRKFEAKWLIIGLDRRTFAHIFFVQKT